MTKISYKSLLVVVATLMLTSIPAFGQPNGQSLGTPAGPSGEMAVAAHTGPEAGPQAVAHVRASLGALKRFLDLSEDQVEAIHGIFESTQEAIREIQELIRPLEVELNELIHTDPPDAAAIGDLVLQIHELRDTIRTLHRSMGESIEGELDDEQLTRLRHAQRASRLEPLFPAMRRLALIPPR